MWPIKRILENNKNFSSRSGLKIENEVEPKLNLGFFLVILKVVCDGNSTIVTKLVADVQ